MYWNGGGIVVLNKFSQKNFSILFCTCFVTLFLFQNAFAMRESTQESLERFEEILRLRQDEGTLNEKEFLPIIVVSASPGFQESEKSFTSGVLAVLGKIFPQSGIRYCVECQRPRIHSADGILESQSGVISLEEVRKFDERIKGDSPPARAGVWLDETPEGISVRFIDLNSGRVIYADNITPQLIWSKRSSKNFSVSRSLLMRQRGDSINHSMIDMGLFPTPHFSLSWAEQWGESNRNLTGLSLSLFTPVLGIGANYYRVFPEMLNIAFGGKVLMSVPTALVASFTKGKTPDLFDPLVTFTGEMRIPIWTTDYCGFAFVASSGKVGLGFCALNISILPVLP